MSSQSGTRKAYSVEEVAEMLGVGRTHAYAMVKSGELPSVRLGRRLLVPAAALDKLLASCETPCPSCQPRRAMGG